MLGYLVACGLALLVGLAELVSRYRDRPAALLRVPSAWTYAAINAASAGSALYLARTFDWTFGASGASGVAATQVLVAAFGSLALFRSSLFTVRIGQQDIGVGPSTALTILLTAADRGVDRARARERSRQVAAIMHGVSFTKAHLALPTFCLGLLQNSPATEQQELGTAVRSLAGSTMTDAQKSFALGLLLINIVGAPVLTNAVEALGPEITTG
ncbi:hypothetical protein ACIPYS_27055 [Kitasatospora sp. NPDC089913]|uniref:hypothetical protein n=1 Tax=Streptomycetaceae TaxID=2062 RepID=UPI000879397F|nr:hypothetical protein [Streptomyces sp. TLI_053]SDT43563.1 hypothetical protein SAMN05216371_2287 [Streptomyces sp. TLI_053]